MSVARIPDGGPCEGERLAGQHGDAIGLLAGRARSDPHPHLVDAACLCGAEQQPPVDAGELLVIAQEAVAAADKLRFCLGATPVAVGGTSIPIRASIGVATWSAMMRSAADLYAPADLALYRAKDLGRDRTELYRPPTTRS
jgi:GGDEF domain-containing protein